MKRLYGIAFVILVLVSFNVFATTVTRKKSTVYAFRSTHPCPANGSLHKACPGYAVDHIKALECGGKDTPSNMQWQTVAAGKAKDKLERLCRTKVK